MANSPTVGQRGQGTHCHGGPPILQVDEPSMIMHSVWSKLLLLLLTTYNFINYINKFYSHLLFYEWFISVPVRSPSVRVVLMAANRSRGKSGTTVARPSLPSIKPGGEL